MSKIQLNLSQDERFAKLKKWMRKQQPPVTFVALSAPIYVSGAVLARNCRNEAMPVYQHEHLVSMGVPVELLPPPRDRRPGPLPTRNNKKEMSM